jgi:peptidoglycan/LPS O-acetylase OafA/YrhL
LAGYQYQKITREQENYWFSNRMAYPRGYSSTAWENFYTLRSNYELTLWNSDLALGPVINIQRIRTELFYDIALGKGTLIDSSTGQEFGIDKDYWSLGVEMQFDFNFMRLLPLLNAGIRAVYTPDNAVKFELVLGNLQI